MPLLSTGTGHRPNRSMPMLNIRNKIEKGRIGRNQGFMAARVNSFPTRNEAEFRSLRFSRMSWF